MSFTYCLYNAIPEAGVLEGILALHRAIFGSSDDVVTKMARKPNLLVMTAVEDNKIIGYKIGYEMDENTFYSWLGGVDINYRKHGVASMLMKKQHDYLKEKGYKVVRTKTMNKWRGMLILNIKHGFDVIHTYVDEKGLHKIVLEKNL